MQREIYRYVHHSGEFGETAYPIRRARMQYPNNEFNFVEMLWRAEYFGPDSNWDNTVYEWEVI